MRSVVRIVGGWLVAAAGAGVLVGCGSELTQAGARVKLMKADPPPQCQEVRGVSAYQVGPDYQDHLKNALRNEAAENGANYVRLETLTSDGNASGTAFACPGL